MDNARTMAICLCCGDGLCAEDGGGSVGIDAISIVYDGIIFEATGNFGSTIFDPMARQEEEILQVVICDRCIKKNAKNVLHIKNIRRITKSEVGVFKIDD